MVRVVSLPAVTSWTKNRPKSTSVISRPSKRLPSSTSVRSPWGGIVRRRAANPIAYTAISTLDEPRCDSSAMSGSWLPELRSARAWMAGKSSGGSPSSRPTIALGR